MVNKNKIEFQVMTLSNLLIGGAALPFEIGGIDQQTAVDQNGLPFIPGSAFKGALRNIVRENEHADIKDMYVQYIKNEKDAHQKQIEKLKLEQEKQVQMDERYQSAEEDASAQYLFGIEGFNNTPRLLFSDLLLVEEFRQQPGLFSIDIKNKIEIKDNAPVSLPRTYRAARGGLRFEGEILLYKIDLLGEDTVKVCHKYIEECLRVFNDGIHRLGNSKSRGYGKIKITNISKYESEAGNR